MEPKKSKRADLESKKKLFFQIGIGITLLCVLLAFDIKQNERSRIDWDNLELDNIDMEDSEITRRQDPPPPPKPDHSNEIIIVPDDTEVDVDIHIDVDAFIDDPVPDYNIVIYREKEVEEDTVFIVVEEYPEFPGGKKALYGYIAKKISYPSLAKLSDIQGTVYLSFIVEPDGSISNVRVMRGIGGGCDEEALRVIKNMPAWIPGKQRNIPVRVQYTLPVSFKLR